MGPRVAKQDLDMYDALLGGLRTIVRIVYHIVGSTGRAAIVGDTRYLEPFQSMAIELSLPQQELVQG